MNVLKQIFLTCAIAIGLSVAVCAQKDGPKRPPKDPPVVNPGKDRPPKNDPPKGGDKPKKPGYAMEIADRIFVIATV